MLYLRSFNNLTFHEYINLDSKGFHQYLEKDKKKYLYIPDRGPVQFSYKNCQEIIGCCSYSYSTSSDFFLFKKKKV